MCNHYRLSDTSEVFDFLKAFEGIEEPPPWDAVSTAWPKSKMPVIYGNRVRTTMRWGVWPHYETEMRLVSNSRDDALLTKSIWKSSAAKRRCLVPADGWYEWTGPKGAKWEVKFELPSKRPFFFAGLWSHDPTAGDRGFSIVTSKPNALIEALPHDRMPVVLSDDDALKWLGGEPLSDERLLSFCQPYSGELVRADTLSSPATASDLARESAPEARRAEVSAKTQAARAAVAQGELWPALQSDDLKTLAAHLRAAGFPVSMIRAVVNARIQRQFTARLNALSGSPQNTPYWQPLASSNQATNAKYTADRAQIFRDRSKLLREVLGDDSLCVDIGEVTAAQRRQFGDLPKSTCRQKLRARLQRNRRRPERKIETHRVIRLPTLSPRPSAAMARRTFCFPS